MLFNIGGKGKWPFGVNLGGWLMYNLVILGVCTVTHMNISQQALSLSVRRRQVN